MKSLLITSTLLSALSSSSLFATPNQLFISEYIEGSGNNKALEIANLSGNTIDLSNYQIKMYFNGKVSSGLTLNLSGILNSGEVHVLAHAKASSEILAVANQTQSSGWFNGDDAITLTSNNVVIDSIGQIGFDPGSQWGNGLESTKNNTLRRNFNMFSGDTNTNDTFIPKDEWSGYSNDNFSDLGKLEITAPPPPPGDTNCGETAQFIHTIQGSGLISTMVGNIVTIEGIVVGDFQANNQLKGFFIQEEDSDRDNNAQTSEGIFVFNHTTNVNTGDQVRITGKVSEYRGMTQISKVNNITICNSNQQVTPVSIRLPFNADNDGEKTEGMKVIFEQSLTVSENYNLGRYGELVLSNGRLFNPTNIVQPGLVAQAMQTQNNLNRIILDDGSSQQNSETIPYPQPELSAFNTVRGGDIVTRLSGVMHHAFGAYRIQPITLPDFQSANLRATAPRLAPETLSVASFNVLNYFNGDGQGAGYPTSRGADNTEEFNRQRDKIISAIAALNADILGLMEIENDGFGNNSAIADLIFGLNTATGKQYQFVQPKNSLIGTDEITVGIIYNSEKVMPIGKTATLSTGAFITKNRQPLAQSFREINSNGQLTIVVNHFKSKGSCPPDNQDPNANQNDGQGCWNVMRTQASQELNQWLQTKPTGVNDADRLIIGDLNAYAMEDPVTELESSGYINLLKKYQGEKNYSYVFFGQAGTLDHALASTELEPQVINALEWHINADEPRVLDYNLEFKSATQQNSLYSTDAYRASDHDPVIISLKLNPELDINNDGKMNIKDIITIARKLHQNTESRNRRYDLNVDGKINFKDLKQIIHAVIKARFKTYYSQH